MNSLYDIIIFILLLIGLNQIMQLSFNLIVEFIMMNGNTENDYKTLEC